VVVSHKIFLVRLFCAPWVLRPGATAPTTPPISYATEAYLIATTPPLVAVVLCNVVVKKMRVW